MRLYDRIASYFLFRKYGIIDTGGSDFDPTSSKKAPRNDMPGWFIDLCDVGVAISKLTLTQQQVVGQRWCAHVDHQEAERAAMIHGQREAIARRKNDFIGALASHEAYIETLDEIDLLKKDLRKLDRRQDYRTAMGILRKLLQKKSPRP
jgi:hypothetical protein